MIVQAFYNGVTQAIRSTVDAAAGGSLMNKTEDEVYNLIEEMTLNNFQWSNEQGQLKLVGGKIEIDALTLLNAKVDAMTQRLERLNVNVVSSSAPPPSCEICDFINCLTESGQVGSPFAQDTSNQVNYVKNFNPRHTNDPYSSTYNLGWRNHPNFLYRPNPSLIPQMDARQPPKFQRPSFPQAPQKSILDAMMESMLLA